MPRTHHALLLALVLACPAAAAPTTADERLVVQSEPFLQAHPDLHHRLRAFDKLGRDDLPGAIEDLLVAARHADKPAQAVLAELHWTGRGVPVDRALAYVWMDLAAERGYPLMIALRERYWAGLAESERKAALALGEAMYGEYGDAVARPRLDALMTRARVDMRRGRGHSVGASRVNLWVGDRFQAVPGRVFKDRKFWTAEGYFAWQDELGRPEGQGRVEVGDLTPVQPE